MTNDLGQFLMATFFLYGGMAVLLYLLAAADPQTDRTELARPPSPRAGRTSTGGRPATLEAAGEAPHGS